METLLLFFFYTGPSISSDHKFTNPFCIYRRFLKRLSTTRGSSRQKGVSLLGTSFCKFSKWLVFWIVYCCNCKVFFSFLEELLPLNIYTVALPWCALSAQTCTVTENELHSHTFISFSGTTPTCWGLQQCPVTERKKKSACMVKP